MSRFLFIILGSVLIGLTCIVLWMWFDTEGQIKSSRWIPPESARIDIASQLVVLPSEEGSSGAAFLSATERPLFSRTRRPPLPPPPPPPPPAPVAPDIFSNAIVKGVLNYQGGSGVIIEMSGKIRRIRTGESVEGWKLLRVEGLSAVFTSGDSQRLIPLTRVAGVKGSGSPISPSLGAVPPVVSLPPVGTSNATTEIVGGGSPAPTPKKSKFGP